ncbi:MAG: carboxypeptidase-like regulatory domain-containing protein [Candidatus Micrarchaeota archaeon]|nr:carboxypeptidase-like regulatory domain-containing protein [Candidatus Micrarchaeota archaeon]
MPNDESDHASKISEILEPLTDAVKKIGLAKIILAVILIAVSLWFINLPKPGALYITVSELDASQPVEGALISLQWPDGQLIGDTFTSITDSSGRVTFTNVPTQRSVTIVVEATGQFDSAFEDISLQSGEEKGQTIKLAKTLDITLAPTSLSGTVSETCVKEAQLTVTNNGNSDVDAIFVGDGTLQNAVSSETQTISPGLSENVTVLLDVSKSGRKKGQALTGEMRIKGTNKKVNLNLQVGESPSIEVSPSSITCPAGRPLCLQVVTVKNNGDSTLNNLKVEPAATITSVLENSDVERYYITNSIPPNSEAKFGVRITPSTPTIGVITITADCYSRQIDVEAG